MEIVAALDDLDAAWDKLASLPVRALSAAAALAVLDRLERHRRRLPGLEHGLISQLQSQATPPDLGGRSWRWCWVSGWG